ncbi:MAG TPA: xanthine dehydrogenase family protein molybdopterin-binding subunit [Synergistaceae bacterium]|nr:xanthine dehydrogenase family protein molybdopterin-binding subunit [Synergistaceae bacterium]HPQ37171.1 xanthine dehydrogenase family protein molybdopterin-binding subunit [Synergistaceae bacterium]
MQDFRIIGQHVERSDAWDKLSGKACYVDDLSFPSMWYGGTLRSPFCRGKILSLHGNPDFDWSRVVVVTPEDLPGPNEVAIVETDHPILAEGEARFFGEPLALVAAPDKELLRRALKALEVEMEELPPLLDPREALEKEDYVRGKTNLFKEYSFSKGDPEQAFEEAENFLEVECSTPHQEQMYLEPQGMIALPTEGGGIEVWGSMQCPYYALGALCHGLGLPPEKVRVRQTVTGGAFGGKEDYPSVLALHAALLARKAQRPVKMILERAEDIACTTKRHPSRSRLRAGFSSEGILQVLDVDLLLDGGAYSTLSPVVLSRGVLHATGGYRVEHVRVRGKAVATNSPPNGAFRGFGAPQMLFGLERMMDAIARKLGMDPAEVRLRNVLRPGDSLPCGQRLPHPGAALVLQRVLELSQYEEKRQRPGKNSENAYRGMGISLYVHGGGFTGSGEEEIAGKVRLEASSDMVLTIRTSCVEMGQGASTVLPMIVSEMLGVPFEQVRYAVPDTREVPNSGPTVASRTTMMVGKILQQACEDLAQRLLEEGRSFFAESGILWENRGYLFPDGKIFSFMEFLRRVFDLSEAELLCGESSYKPLVSQGWDDRACRGDAYKDYSWGANVLEIEIHKDTLEITPLHLTSVIDVGIPLHPLLASGQVEGGALQSLGYAYMEDVAYRNGKYTKHRMATYSIPTTLDTPVMEISFDGIPFEHGPWGAKGLGELPMNGGAPAMAGAVEDALGIVPRDLPLTPQELYRLLAEKERRA